MTHGARNSLGRRLLVTLTDNEAAPPPPAVPQVSFDLLGSTNPDDAGVVGVKVSLDIPATTQVIAPFTITFDRLGTPPATRDDDFQIVTDAGGLTDLAIDQVIIPLGGTSTTLWVSVTDDADAVDEAFVLNLVETHASSDLVGATLGDNRTHIFFITPVTKDPTISFSAESSIAVETDSTFTHNVVVRLSHASASTVTADVAQTNAFDDGAATVAVDYNLLTPVVTILAGATTFIVEVEILDTTIFEGDRPLELGLSRPTNATLGVVIRHIVDIQDDEVEADPDNTVDLRDETVAGFLVPETVNGATQYFAFVEIDELNPANSPIAVTYSLTPSGANPAVAGVDYELASANPVIIAQGATFTVVRFTAVDDGVFEGDRTFDLELLTAVGGNATLAASSIIATGTVVDAQTDGPTASFNGPTAIDLVEGGSGVGIQVELVGANPDGVAITVGVQGTAVPADYSVTWPGGQKGVVVIPAGEAFATIQITALTDRVADDGETVQFVLTAGGGYVVGAPAVVVVTINEAPDVGDTVVEFEPIAGLPTALVQFCTGIDPVAATALPVLYLDGVRADVFPVAYRHDGLVDWVQVVGMSNNTGQAILSTTGSQSGASWFLDDLSGMRFQLGIDGAYVADPLSNLVETMREGEHGFHVREDVFWSQFTDPAGATNEQNVGSVHVFLTRRSDCRAFEMSVIVANDVYDPTQDPTIAHADQDGDIYTRYVRATLPAGYSIKAEFEGPAMNTNGPSTHELLKTEPSEAGSDVHLLPVRMRFVRHYVVAHSSVAQQTIDDLLLRKGYGTAITGPYAATARPGFGAQGEKLPEFDENYIFGALTGRDAARERSRQQYEDLRALAISGESGGNGFPPVWQHDQTTDPGSYFHPYGWSDTQQGSGVGIMLRHGYHNVPDELRACEIMGTYGIQRQPLSLTYKGLGRLVLPADVVAANPITGKYPFACNTFQSGRESQFPHFIKPAGGWGVGWPPGPGTYDDLKLAPEAKPWNSDGGETVHEPPEVQPWHHPSLEPNFATNSWLYTDNDHHSRYFHYLQPLVYNGNFGWAKWVMRGAGNWVMHSQSRYDIAGIVPNQFWRDTYGVEAMRLALVADSRTAWGGYRKSGGYNGLWGRGMGHMLNCVSHAMRIVPQGTLERSEYEAWMLAMRTTLTALQGPWGCTNREDKIHVPTEDGNHPSNAAWWGATDLVNQTGAIPSSWSANQYFYTSYMAWGMMGCAHAAFDLTLAANEPLLRTILTTALSMWRVEPLGARRPGLDRPVAWTITSYAGAASTGLDGMEDPPEALPKAWSLTAIGTSYTPDIDYRGGVHLAAAYRAARIVGDTAAQTEIIEYSKLLVGLQTTSSMDQLLARLQRRMDDDPYEESRNIGSQYAPLLGELQY